jgi:hypothetical protein
MLLMTLVVFADDGARDALAVEKRLLSLLALGHVAADEEVTRY